MKKGYKRINVLDNSKTYCWQNAGPQGAPLLSTNVGVWLFYGLVVANFICQQILIPVLFLNTSTTNSLHKNYLILVNLI